MSQLVRLEGKHTTQNAHCALFGSQKGGRNRAMVNAKNGNEKVWNKNLFAHIATLNTFDKVELRLALLASMHDLDS